MKQDAEWEASVGASLRTSCARRSPACTSMYKRSWLCHEPGLAESENPGMEFSDIEMERLAQWQPHADNKTAALPVGEAETPAVGFDDLAAQGQPQSAAGLLGGI